MAELMDRELLKRYHCALVRSNINNLEKLKARLGAEWAEGLKESCGAIADPGEFARALGEYLEEDLRLCEEANAVSDDGSLTVSIKGCHICHANEELRRQEKPTMCPVIPTGLQSLSKVHGRKASLEGVEKTGVVGECTIKYRLN